MWASLSVLGTYIDIPNTILHAVARMRQAFHVLYLFDFSDDIGQQALEWYKSNIKQVSITISMKY
jgi:hypothetical protein